MSVDDDQKITAISKATRNTFQVSPYGSRTRHTLAAMADRMATAPQAADGHLAHLAFSPTAPPSA